MKDPANALEGVDIKDDVGPIASVFTHRDTDKIIIMLKDHDKVDEEVAQQFNHEHAEQIANAIMSLIGSEKVDNGHIQRCKLYRIPKLRPESPSWRNDVFYVDKICGDMALVTYIGRYADLTGYNQYRIDLNRYEMERVYCKMLTRCELKHLEDYMLNEGVRRRHDG